MTVSATKVQLVDPITGDAYGSNEIGGRQEALTLIDNNVPAAAQSVYGGDYIFAQQASAYGTITLQVMNPDGSTYSTLVSKTASDTTSSTLVTLGTNATVKAVADGTTAAYATLSRAPA